jgi:hypothetical protein
MAQLLEVMISLFNQVESPVYITAAEENLIRVDPMRFSANIVFETDDPPHSDLLQ